ncbi:E3 ubiquitin-protein ligase Bre1 [Dermatophagoides pteronyssinus]|uniref:E3 ubiquitin-protein ligase Bre1 n=1 Tax=Dermatophagoides pteronyssinus TaxID=6956 RepID=UPI003F6752D9
MATIGSKRSCHSADQNNAGGGGNGNQTPAKKRSKMDIDFDVKFVASSQDDLDIGLLRVQNRRLTERIKHRQRIEAELRARLEQMEKKQLNDDTKLYVINRYWNQLNEDMRLLLQRFDTNASNDSNANPSTKPNDDNIDDDDDSNEDGDEDDSNDDDTGGRGGGHRHRNENAETTSFVRQLANLDKEELDEQMQQRVLLSTRAVSKVLQAFDRIVQRNEKVMAALNRSSLLADDDAHDEPDTIKSPDRDDDDDIDDDDDCKLSKAKANRHKHGAKMNLDEQVRQLNEELTLENKNLNLMVTSLHEKNRTISLKYQQAKDRLDSKDMQLDELKNRIDELEFELNKSRTREQRLEDHLYEAREKLRDMQNSQSTAPGSSGSTAAIVSNDSNKQDTAAIHCSTMSSTKIEDLKRELEEQREIAQSRLVELEQLNNEHKDTLKLVEKYKIDLQCLPDSVIKDSAEFKSLQSHFSVLFNESMTLKTQLEECRQQLSAAKNVHMRQIEQMEAEELTMQKRLRNECMQLDDSLNQLRKEYEMLRLEFEQTLAANEQTGPINREMRHLITSLQNHTQQLKGENARIKKRLKESNVEIGRLRQIIEQNNLKVCCGGILLPSSTTSSSSATTATPNRSADNAGSASWSTTCTVDCCQSTTTTGQQQQPKTELDSSSSSTDIKSEPLSSTMAMAAESSSSEDLSKRCIIKSESSTNANHTPPSSSTISSTSVVKKESPELDCLEFASTNTDNESDHHVQQQQPHSSSSSSGSSHQVVATTHSQQQRNLPPPPSSSSSLTNRKSEADTIRDMRAQLKKSWEAQRELKILLDMFKSVDKEKREKAQLMASEKKLRIELEELRQQNKKLIQEDSGSSSLSSSSKRSEKERRFSGSGGGLQSKSAIVTTDEEHKKMAKYEDIIRELQKNVAAHKQQEQALLNEMEVTGQAFEDMQEQNCRLIQQLREKDDANFKLMSDRIKSNQIHKMLKEEKEHLTEQIFTLQQQIEAQNQVVRKLEERERILQNSLSTAEKELTVRQQAMDFLKRKALESSQSAADLKLHLDKYVAQIKDAQSIVADKTSAWQQETYRTKRLHEEVIMYKRKYERAKKFELAATADEVLQEEIRELREELTCPSCKTKRKDAVLNKCFHVFCYDCLKTRYETRQRKCPKCNQSFSANDFHRLYLA